MRNALLAIVGLSLAAASTPAADACGVYMMSPRVFWVAHNSGDKSFIVEGLDASPIDDAQFTRLAPRSYDASAVAEQPRRAAPFAVTIVGARTAARSVSSDHEVVLRGAWSTRGKQVRALEIDAPSDDRDLLAVAGTHAGLRLSPIAWPTPAHARITPTITADVTYDAAIGDYRATLHDGKGDVIGRMVGMPRAVLAADGAQHLVVDNNGIANAYLL